MTPATFISSSDLEERLALWREIAIMQRDKHEEARFHGKGQLAIAVDFGADAVETCIRDIEELIGETRGEGQTDGDGSGAGNDGQYT